MAVSSFSSDYLYKAIGMSEKELTDLIDRYLSGEVTEQEKRQVELWYESFDKISMDYMTADRKKLKAYLRRSLKAVHLKIEGQKRKQRLTINKPAASTRRFRAAAAAAAILLLIGGGIYLTGIYVRAPEEQLSQQRPEEKIQPGGNKAILTLSSGRSIVLDSTSNGLITTQGGAKVIKSNKGQLTYQRVMSSEEQLYNTITTPRGGQYQVILPDGSKVWLNSVSSIRFPTEFNGESRKIEITGEVYLEVAHDTRRPFIVSSRQVDITVLGTRFNIMAYEDEPAVTTTLVEGSVKISIPGNPASRIIRPDQQASVDFGGREIKVTHVDAARVAGWIDGLLSLKECSVKEFMNQLSRWYDVDIEYSGKIPSQKFGGLINRNAPLPDVLSALDAGGIHTKLQGKKLVVLSN